MTMTTTTTRRHLFWVAKKRRVAPTWEKTRYCRTSCSWLETAYIVASRKPRELQSNQDPFSSTCCFHHLAVGEGEPRWVEVLRLECSASLFPRLLWSWWSCCYQRLLLLPFLLLLFFWASFCGKYIWVLVVGAPRLVLGVRSEENENKEWNKPNKRIFCGFIRARDAQTRSHRFKNMFQKERGSDISKWAYLNFFTHIIFSGTNYGSKWRTYYNTTTFTSVTTSAPNSSGATREQCWSILKPMCDLQYRQCRIRTARCVFCSVVLSPLLLCLRITLTSAHPIFCCNDDWHDHAWCWEWNDEWTNVTVQFSLPIRDICHYGDAHEGVAMPMHVAIMIV